MKTILQYLILMTVFFTCSCDLQKEKYIGIDDYKITDNNPHLFRSYSKKKAIIMKCSSNFPPETVIVVKKEIGVQTTHEKSLMKYKIMDTLVLKQNKFEIYFSPSFIGGELSFSVFRSLQNEKVKEQLVATVDNATDRLYSVEYSTDYEIMENTEQSVKLIIEKWD